LHRSTIPHSVQVLRPRVSFRRRCFHCLGISSSRRSCVRRNSSRLRVTVVPYSSRRSSSRRLRRGRVRPWSSRLTTLVRACNCRWYASLHRRTKSKHLRRYPHVRRVRVPDLRVQRAVLRKVLRLVTLQARAQAQVQATKKWQTNVSANASGTIPTPLPPPQAQSPVRASYTAAPPPAPQVPKPAQHPHRRVHRGIGAGRLLRHLGDGGGHGR